MQIIFIVILVAVFIFLLNGIRSKKLPQKTEPLPGSYKAILEEHVTYYKALDAPNKLLFENKMSGFLSSIKIEGINTSLEDMDRVFIAASAIIPIFAFPGCVYPNLNTILLYPEHFNEDFDMKGNEKPVMGMVGSGAMNYNMILSKPALHEGFMNETDKNNTGIHEFVHLLDKMDGDIDGIPAILLKKQYTLPWINLIHENISNIIENKSDINPYGATNKAEFFAVAAEYFFERPDLFKEKHPKLFSLMQEMFQQHPENKKSNATG